MGFIIEIAKKVSNWLTKKAPTSVGVIGLILFVFGIITYALTQITSMFLYVHIYTGLAFILWYFVFTFTGSKKFLGTALLIILSVLAVFISGSSAKNIYAFAIPSAVLFVVFFGFNLEGFSKPKKLPYLIIPHLLFALALVFRKDLDIGKYWWFLAGYGLILAIFHFILNFKDIRKGVLGKSTKYAVNSIVYSIFVLIIIIVLNGFGFYIKWKKDLTEAGINTLSEQSINVIKSLDTTVTITPFFVDKNPNKKFLEDVLDKYTYKSKFIKVDFVDPDVEPQKAKLHDAKDGNILIECEGEQNMITDVTEQAITSAIMKVIRTEKAKVCFTSKHGEMSLTSDDANGISALAGGLKNDGFETKTLASVTEGIPDDCNILAVIGPKIPFTKMEAAAIGKYLDDGGKGLFLLDPRIPDEKLNVKMSVLDTGLEDVAGKQGVSLGKDFVLEKHKMLFLGTTLESSVHATEYASHPITEPLQKQGNMTFFQNGVRSVTKAKSVGKDSTVTELVFSAKGKGHSWAERDVDKILRQKKAEIDPVDIPGPVPIAAAVENKIHTIAQEKGDITTEEKISKSVWVGNSTFLSNNNITSREYNYDMALNMLAWLWGEEIKISIRPKLLRTSSIVLTPEQTNIVFYVCVLGIPELILILGLVIWIFRRKK